MEPFKPKQFGKYFLIDKLAVGGMAEIYEAKTFGAEGFEKFLAIKRILPHCAADKEFITMLIDEAKLSVLLSHANIVQVYDLGKVGDDYFIAMEYINGVNLRDVIVRAREQAEAIPPDIAVYIVSEMCKGLDYAHRKTDSSGQPLGIVHRDISPQNVLLSFEGEVKIVDFGIAKAAMNISHTMAGILKGKIAYMSPEQAMGKSIDRRTDIFSTGILLYEMLTGEKLYTGESQFEVLKKIRTTKIDAGKLSDSIPQQLRPILAKALAYSPDTRFQSAGDFQVELTKFLYAMYLDFSPRKLSKFISKMFKQEIKESSKRVSAAASIDQQTTSMNVAEEKRQVELVHSSTLKPDTTTTRARKEKKRTLWRFGIATVLVISAVVGGYFASQHIPGFHAAIEEPLKPTTGDLPEKSGEEKKPEPVATPKPIPEKVIINVISDPPRAAILLNDRATGLTTPATMTALLHQQLKITITKPGYKNFESEMTVDKEEPYNITARLTSLTPEVKTAETPPTPKLEPTPKKPKPEPKKPAPKPQPKTAETKKPAATSSLPGKIKIASNPTGADVFINSEYRGTTPLTVEAASGSVAIVVTKEGKANYTKRAILKPGETLDLSTIKLLDPFGELSIVTTPPRATVVLNGEQIPARTPVTIRRIRTDQLHSIKITLKGHKEWSRSFTMDREEQSFNILLEKD